MDNGRQQRRQSSDFKEVWNIQSDMNVSQNKWDYLFHNWAYPTNCPGSKKPTGCVVCEHLKMYGRATDNRGIVHGVNIAFLGDIHSSYENVNKFINSNPDVAAIVCTGDLALWSDMKEAEKDVKAFAHTEEQIRDFYKNPIAFKIPIFVLKGNHEDFDNMYSDWFKDLNIHYLKQAEIYTVNNLTFAGIGGIYSPVKIEANSDFFNGREKRFYTNSEISKLVDNASKHEVDVLLTHQAAANVLPEDNKSGRDEGSSQLEELLVELAPIYYIHGHHHINYAGEYKPTKVYGLGNFSRNEDSYIKINSLTKEVVM